MIETHLPDLAPPVREPVLITANEPCFEESSDARARAAIAEAAHEIRTPIASIQAAVEMVLSGTAGPIADEAEAMLRIALSNAHRMTRLVNDILDLERLAAQRGKEPLAEINLADAISVAAADVEPCAYIAGVRIDCRASQVAVRANPEALQRVLTNLLSNAIRHTGSGGSVAVNTFLRDDEIVVSISDRGQGIPESMRERIFQRFERGDETSGRPRTGLGLALTRGMVEAMGGRIWFDSSPGDGTIFHFTLRLADRRSNKNGMQYLQQD